MALTWPLPLQLSRAIPRGQPDSWQNIWNFWWLRTALFERGVNPYQTDLLFYPYRDSRNPLGLYYHTLQPALSVPGSLLTYLFNYALTYNLIILFGFVATGWAMYALSRYYLADSLQPTVHSRTSGGEPALTAKPFHATNPQPTAIIAFVVGALYTFSVFHWHNLAQGQTSVFWLQWLPLYVLLLQKAIAPLRAAIPKRRDSLLAALVLILCTYSDLYYTLYLLLYSLVFLAVVLIRRRGQNWLEIAGRTLWIFLPWMLLAGPLVGAMLLNANDPTVRFVEGREVEVLQSVALPSYFIPSRGLERGWLPYFLGYTTLALAAIGLWRSKWRGLGWTILVIVALGLALGPFLRLDQNQRPEQALKNLPLPYFWFSQLPLVSNGRSPVRFIALAQLGLAMLAGWGILGLGDLLGRPGLLRKGAIPLVAGLALVIFVAEVNVWPLALQELPRPIIFSQIAAEPDKSFAILELPLNGHYTEDARRMYFQTLHHHPSSSGYISRRTEDYDKLAGSPFRQFFGRDNLPADPIFDTTPVDLRLLNFYNIKYVINYRDEYPKDDPDGFVKTEERLTRLLGPAARVYSDEMLSAYRLTQQGGSEPFPIAAPGFFPAQKLQDGRNYRWAGQEAALTLALPAPTKVQLRLTAWSYALENILEIKLAGRTIAQLRLTSTPTEMLTPPLDLPAGAITLQLHSTQPARSPKELNQGEDERKLAFALAAVQLN